MTTARQLYDFQGVDQQIKSAEDILKEKTAQQQESESLKGARDRLATEKQRLDILRKQQRDLEAAVAKLASKIAPAEDQLYGGKIRNPKELINLQSEFSTLKAKRDEQETGLLLVMEQTEQAQKNAEAAAAGFKEIEAGWQEDQRRLVTEIEQIKVRLKELRQGLDGLACEIDAGSLDLYQRLKKAKGQAVAKVEQGICRGCRISVSTAELQQARSGKLATCSSCGRIMYLP